MSWTYWPTTQRIKKRGPKVSDKLDVLNGILCLEGDWEEGLQRQRSIRFVLDLMRCEKVPVIYRSASTRVEFFFVINQWLKKKYKGYPILYLGFHGKPGSVLLTEDTIELSELSSFFEGQGRGRMIHFGSCQTLDVGRKTLIDFLKISGLEALTGFRKEVDWLLTCALEIVILTELTRRRITAANIQVFESNMRKTASTLVRKLGFQMVRRTRV